MNKLEKSVTKKLRRISDDMLRVYSDVHKLSPSNSDQLQGAAFQIIEWIEDIKNGKSKGSN